MTEGDTLLFSKLQHFLNRVDLAELEKQVSTIESDTDESFQAIFETYRNEAITALALISPQLDKNSRILEVGAGLCLFSLFLKSEGYNIIALEPALSGFEYFEAIKHCLIEYHSNCYLDVVTLPAEGLDPDIHGRFDLIFSNNVIEHIDELDTAMSAMASVLHQDGNMVHGCPNYYVPYEPHFGIPVLWFWPNLSRKWFARKIAPKQGLWNSLNFVTTTRIRKLCRISNLRVHFKKGCLYEAIQRLENDPVFRARHKQSIAGAITVFLSKLRLTNMLRLLPPALATPMVFQCVKKLD